MAEIAALRLPEEFDGPIKAEGLLVDNAINFDLGVARQAAFRELDLLFQAEYQSGRRLHKGHPLHNIAITYFAQDPVQARQWFIAAAAEDARTWRRRARGWQPLAQQMLRRLYGATDAFISRVNREARRNPEVDPRELQVAFADAGPQPVFPARIVGVRREEDLHAVEEGHRIFVGGSYPGAQDRLDTIARAVVAAGYEPVIVAEYETLPGERPRTKSFRLLDHCRGAIFDGTVQVAPGWWPEVERIVQVQDQPIPTLIVYVADRADRKYTSSSMFPSEADHPGMTFLGFADNEHLGRVVNWWLLKAYGYGNPSLYSLTAVFGEKLVHEMRHSLGSLNPYLPPPSGAPYEPLGPGSGRIIGGDIGSATPYVGDYPPRPTPRIDPPNGGSSR
jgi:hypothetical protein